MAELCKSDKASRLGIANTPNETQRANMIALIEHVLDPCRDTFGAPISVSSGFRCASLNSEVGGETNSQHKAGEAADLFSYKGVGANFRIGRILAEYGVFDQLIFEGVGKDNMLPSWIHVSYKRNGNNRGQMLKKIKGRKGYIAITKKDIGL